MATVIETERESRIDTCVECCVRDRDFSQKKVYRCELCERWFCGRHLKPKLAFVKNLEAFENTPEIRALYYTEIQGKEGKGHPDFEYSRRKFMELKMEEKRLNELIKQALDRMNHYYDEVEIPEKLVDAEAERKKRVGILLREERELNNTNGEDVRFTEGVETVDTRYGFVVPREVYSNPEYREYLDHADNVNSVKEIVEEYYRKYPQKKGLSNLRKKKHWWQ